MARPAPRTHGGSTRPTTLFGQHLPGRPELTTRRRVARRRAAAKLVSMFRRKRKRLATCRGLASQPAAGGTLAPPHEVDATRRPSPAAGPGAQLLTLSVISTCRVVRISPVILREQRWRLAGLRAGICERRGPRDQEVDAMARVEEESWRSNHPAELLGQAALERPRTRARAGCKSMNSRNRVSVRRTCGESHKCARLSRCALLLAQTREHWLEGWRTNLRLSHSAAESVNG
jgi:hypothetical protein